MNVEMDQLWGWEENQWDYERIKETAPDHHPPAPLAMIFLHSIPDDLGECSRLFALEGGFLVRLGEK